jgi:hypothetical protein
VREGPLTKATPFLGIDVQKAVGQVCGVAARGGGAEELRVRRGTEADGREVLRRLPRWKTTGRFVVEALGLKRWLVNACQHAGFDMGGADA